jgi:hypothetical protein
LPHQSQFEGPEKAEEQRQPEIERQMAVVTVVRGTMAETREERMAKLEAIVHQAPRRMLGMTAQRR